jgi:thioredoxin reductase (NADPH)
MQFFTTPERLEIGGHPLVCAGQKATREEALKYYRGVVRVEGIRVQTYTKFTGLEPRTWDKLVLATGYFDQPNHLGVPGEELPHVRHYFDEAHLSYGRDAVVIGGKNSAVEATLQLFRAGARATIIYRGSEWPKNVKYWLRPDLENRIKADEIQARLEAQVLEITPRDVRIRSPKGEERIPASRVYPLIGFHPDLELFKRLGVAFDSESGRPQLDPDTLETSVPGVHVAGSAGAGFKISDVFIENGRFDGEKIFGTPKERARARDLYQGIRRETGE